MKIGVCGFPASRKRIFSSLDALEVQKTFYDPPGEDTLKKWSSEAPDHFSFTVKAWQIITHPPSSPTYRRLKSVRVPQDAECGYFTGSDLVEHAFRRTLACAKALRSRIILFQTPSSFKPEKANIERAVQFFKNHRSDEFHFVFEPRKWDVKSSALVADEAHVNIAFDPLSLSDEEFSFFLNQRLIYVRLHGVGGYRYRYSREELTEILNRLSPATAPVYIMFNNVYMFYNALEMKEILEKVR